MPHRRGDLQILRPPLEDGPGNEVALEPGGGFLWPRSGPCADVGLRFQTTSSGTSMKDLVASNNRAPDIEVHVWLPSEGIWGTIAYSTKLSRVPSAYTTLCRSNDTMASVVSTPSSL
jgi:hypothetical protein